MNLSKVHHIAIIVSDYEAAKDFYVNKLGFSVTVSYTHLDVYKRQVVLLQVLD